MRMPFGGHHGNPQMGLRAKAASKLRRPSPSGPQGMPPAVQAQQMGGNPMKPKMTMDNSNPTL